MSQQGKLPLGDQATPAATDIAAELAAASVTLQQGDYASAAELLRVAARHAEAAAIANGQLVPYTVGQYSVLGPRTSWVRPHAP